MNNHKYITLTANEAVAKIAYKTNDVCAIYPITPASEMSELVEKYNALDKKNIFGNTTSVFQMQSEAGVAGAMHGALQTGSLTTTFTASQGLLLMLPNMYKIAGELTPNVIHVATRTIATHALSVFGDHSDVMAVRNSGYAFLGSSSVQEAQDFALISQAATLKSRLPFVHFFDGFRTSHEANKIESILDDTIKKMIDTDYVFSHRDRALNPNKPVLRGSTQGPATYFQSREAQNSFYNSCPEIVQKEMDKFALLTGRQYKIFEYVGHSEAEHVLVSMASSCETIENTIKTLNTKGEKIGLIKIRLFRPFSTKHLIEALPKTIKSIVVLDRTKESGAAGEPLYLDVVESLTSAFQNNEIDNLPIIIGARYGLSSREFTPGMVKAVVKNLKQKLPKKNFTIGIEDDVTNLSINYSEEMNAENTEISILIYESKTPISQQSAANFTKLIGENTKKFIQSYTEIDYRKTNSRNVTNIRIDNNPIKNPYLIQKASLILCDNISFVENDDVVDRLCTHGSILVNSKLTSRELINSISGEVLKKLQQKGITIYTLDLSKLKRQYDIKNTSVSALHASILVLHSELIYTCLLSNFYMFLNNETLKIKDEIKSQETIKTYYSLADKLLSKDRNKIKVSELPVDGTFETGNSYKQTLESTKHLPVWDTDLCTQCGLCSMACPQSALVIKAYENAYLNASPSDFKYTKSIETDWNVDLLNYTIQVNPNQCNGCNNCVDACPAKALQLESNKNNIQTEIANWNHFTSIPYLDRTKIDNLKVSQQQLQESLFKYSIGDEGCGEAPYLKLVSQLFGDRMLVANATGASSIFGGALPTTPWSKNQQGQGPAWSNSLFEDNAEFGLGFRKSINYQETEAKNLLDKLRNIIDESLVENILNASQGTEKEILVQKERVHLLNQILEAIDLNEAKRLLKISENLIKKSVWIIGGDGWAYDIGFGGIDHVLSSGENVNILVLDNEVYDNTGGQLSKATPMGANAKFAHNGNLKQKKDLGLMAMNYENVYVASVAIGADPEQTLKAFVEAENFDGPSIIIAYCHSKSHGIDMRTPSKYHKAAVASGQWLLYRNDPRNLNEFQLDSDKPSIKIADYLKLEKRFRKVLQFQNSKNKNIIETLQNQVDKRFYKYSAYTN